MKIHGFNKTTLLDYPGHLASTVFSGGCNLRCPFCQNASLVLSPEGQPEIPEDEFFQTLKKRRNILEGVCITGGEPTLYNKLPDFIRKIKDYGFDVKLDTNGSNPQMLLKMLDSHLLDYVAMDIKNSPENYAVTVGIPDYDITPVKDSVKILMSSDIPYEFRTTVVKEFHKKDDFISVGRWIKGADAYYLQAFKDSGDLIQQGLSGYTKSEMEQFCAAVIPFVPNTHLRGID